MKFFGTTLDGAEEVVGGGFALPATPGDLGWPPHAAASEDMNVANATTLATRPARFACRGRSFAADVPRPFVTRIVVCHRW
jgi:hypothetical protein